jgi:TatD DNase family protein
MNEPAYVRLTAEFLADLRAEDFATFADATTANAKRLFSLK